MLRVLNASRLVSASFVALLTFAAQQAVAECRAPTACIDCHQKFGYPPTSALENMAAQSCEVGDFTRGKNLTMPRFIHRTAKLPDGRVLLTGGAFKIWDTTPSADLFDPANDSLTPVAPMAQKRFSHIAVTLADGRVLVAGGRTTNSAATGVMLKSAELYDPVTNTWSPTAGPLNVARRSHTATLLANGKVLITGGGNGVTTASIPMASAELFDPQTGLFTLTSPMTTPRLGHGATMLANGKVLVTGGSDGTGTSHPTAAAEIFDPTTNTFTSIGVSNFPHIAQMPALLRDGRVLMAGSYYNPLGSIFGGGTLSDDVEIFNPVGNTFAVAPNMFKKRIDIGGALLLDGSVLIAGGVATNVGPSKLTVFHSSAEVYDPATNQWQMAGIMSAGRDEFSGLTLDDGRVYVSGGYNNVAGPTLLNTVEIYTPGLKPQIMGLLNSTGELPLAAYRGGKKGRTAINDLILNAGKELGMFSGNGNMAPEYGKALVEAQKLYDKVTQQMVDPATRVRLQSIVRVLINTLTDKITPNLPPTVTPVANPVSGVEPLNVSFNANALDADGEIVGISWNFDDGSMSTLANPTHVFQCDGTYDVTVQVTDDKGAAATGSVTVTTTSAGGPLSYSCDVQLTFNKYCAACHGGSGGLNLSSCANLQAGGISGPSIIPGSKELSRLWVRINEGSMPATGGRIPQLDIDRIGQWIDGLDPADANYCD